MLNKWEMYNSELNSAIPTLKKKHHGNAFTMSHLVSSSGRKKSATLQFLRRVIKSYKYMAYR